MTLPPPQWTAITSPTGHLRVRWDRDQRGDGHVIIALRPIDPGLTDAFWAGELDNDLIRIPIALADEGVEAHVPAGRIVWVALITRDGSPAPPLTITVDGDGPPPASRLEGPIDHQTSADKEVPLIFVDGEGPDLRALVARVARQAEGVAPATEASTPPITALSAIQGPYLTRIQWPVLLEEGARLLTTEGPFDVANLVESEAVQSDIVRVIPSGSHGLVDGLTAPGACMSYIVLSGPEGWNPVAVHRVRPPYIMEGSPWLLGDVEARLMDTINHLAHQVDTAPAALHGLALQAELIEGACACLAESSPARARGHELALRMRDHPRFGP
jgi:hypothetical protein